MQKIDSIYIQSRIRELLIYSEETEMDAKDIVSEMSALMRIFKIKLTSIEHTHIM